MKTFYLTDSGKVRDHNEDSVTILKNASDEYLLIVADGMGGHRAGEVASSISVNHMGKKFTELPAVGDKLEAINWMRDNISEINNPAIQESIEKIFFNITIAFYQLGVCNENELNFQAAYQSYKEAKFFINVIPNKENMDFLLFIYNLEKRDLSLFI